MSSCTLACQCLRSCSLTLSTPMATCTCPELSDREGGPTSPVALQGVTGDSGLQLWSLCTKLRAPGTEDCKVTSVGPSDCDTGKGKGTPEPST